MTSRPCQREAEAVITDAGRHLFRKAAALHSREVKDLCLDHISHKEADTLVWVYSRLGRGLEDGEG